ncbi:hypothetical protein D3C80_1901560 [compost metagenome]
MDKVNPKRMARGQLPSSMFLKKLYKRYSYLGRRNFISYGYRAARIIQPRSRSSSSRTGTDSANACLTSKANDGLLMGLAQGTCP